VRVTRVPSYPFEPRSNAYLEPGQFWGIPLSDGRFACGRVLAIPGDDDMLLTGSTKEFAAGLLNWTGNKVPTGDSIAGSPVLTSGIAHIKAIRLNGQFILGTRPLGSDGIGDEIAVTHRSGGTPYVYRNFERVRPASREEIAALPMVRHWGYNVIRLLAENVFVQGGALPDETLYGYA
jgi:hypothetical protein